MKHLAKQAGNGHAPLPFPPWKGPAHFPERWTWGETYKIKSKTLNTICNEYDVIPDFIHVDAQGAEYNIFKIL